MGVYKRNSDGSLREIASNTNIMRTPQEGYVTEAELIAGLATKQDVIQYETLPTASIDELGNIYQYVGETNVSYTHGYFYECVSDGATTPTYSWIRVNVQPNSGGGTDDYTDLANKPQIEGVTLSGNKTASNLGLQAKMQLSTMPTASTDYLNRIIQYTGTTNSTYTNGYFYKCISDGGDPAVYSWIRVDTQPNLIVTPEQFGAVGDGVTDDTAAFTAAFAASPNVKCDGSKTYNFAGVVETTRSKGDLDLCGATFINFHIKICIASDGYKSFAPNATTFFKIHDGNIGVWSEIPNDWQTPAIQIGTQAWLENLVFTNTPYVAGLTNNYRDRMVFRNMQLICQGALWTDIGDWTLDAINLITGDGTFAKINRYDITHVPTASSVNTFAGDGWVIDNIDQFCTRRQNDYFFIHTYKQHTLNINRCVQSKFAIGVETYVEFSNCHFESSGAMPTIEYLANSSSSSATTHNRCNVDFDNCWFTDTYVIEADKPNVTYTNCYFRVCSQAIYPETPFATITKNYDYYDMSCRLIDCTVDVNSNVISSEEWKRYKEQPKLTRNNKNNTVDEDTLSECIDATKTIGSGDYKYPATGTYSYVGYTFTNSTYNIGISSAKIAHEKYQWTRTVSSTNGAMDGSVGMLGLVGGWGFEIYRTLPDSTIQRARFFDSPIDEEITSVVNKKFHIREYGNYLVINKTVLRDGGTYSEIPYRLPWVTVTSIPTYTVNNKVYEKNGVLVTTDNSVINGITNTSAYIQVDDKYANNIAIVNTLPTPSSTELGNIYIYMGASDQPTGLGHGGIYECISDGESTPTYSWELVGISVDMFKYILTNCNDFNDFKTIMTS